MAYRAGLIPEADSIRSSFVIIYLYPSSPRREQVHGPRGLAGVGAKLPSKQPRDYVPDLRLREAPASHRIVMVINQVS